MSGTDTQVRIVARCGLKGTFFLCKGVLFAGMDGAVLPR